MDARNALRFVIPLFLVLTTGCIQRLGSLPPSPGNRPIHVETRANAFTYNRQLAPSIAVDREGRLLVAWGSRRQESGTFGVFAQRFDPLGRRVGTEFHVNETVRGMQLDPAVAFDGTGVAWIAWQSTGQDGDQGAIIARRFGAGGSATFGPLSDEIAVNETTVGNQADPAIAANPGGEVFITWTSDAGGRRIVKGRVFRLDGTPSSEEFDVGEGAGGHEAQPGVASLGDGRFVAVWARTDPSGSPGNILARRFEPDGTPIGSELVVNPPDGRQHIEPAIDATADGRFAVVWLTWQRKNYGVSYRLYDAAGQAAGPARRFTPSEQWCSGANVALAPDGRFVISYNLDDDEDGMLDNVPVRPSHRSTPSEIWARKYSPVGEPAGEPFRVNRIREGRQALVIGASGRQALWSGLDQLAFVWTGNTGREDHRGVGLSMFVPDSLSVPPPPPAAREPAPLAITGVDVYANIPPVFDPDFVPEPPDPPSPFRGVDTGFIGVQNTGWTPPDPDLAAGPDQLVLVVNGQIAFYEQDGTRTFAQAIAGGGGFWGSVGATSFVFDPVAVYDVHSGRFIAGAAEHANNGDDLLVLAVSDDSDPNGTWHKYRFNMSGFGDFIDFPNLGVDKDAIYVTADFFDVPTGNWIFIFPKAPMLVGDPVTPSSIQTSGGPRSLASVKTYDVGAPAQYFATAFDGGSSQIAIDAVTDPIGAPVRSTFHLGVPSFASPPDAEQLGTSNRADTIDIRIKNGVYRNGSLWLVHTIGESGTARVRWYEVEMNGWPTSGQDPSLRQSGTFDFGDGEHNWMADIHVSDAGDAILCFNRSSINQFISVDRGLRFAADPLGTFREPEHLQESTSAELGSRWGDYAGVDEEPDDPGIFWTHNEFRTTSWRTWVGRVPAFDRLRLLLLSEAPTVLQLGIPTALDVEILPGDEALVPGSPTLHYRYDGGAFLTAPLAAAGGDLYTATLPAPQCGALPEFYISADGTTTGIVALPQDAPNSVFTAEVPGPTQQWDDGSAEASLGAPNGAELAILNRFITQGGFESIGAVSLAWGPVANGTPATVYLWSDPDGDGNPTDARVLASAATTVQNADTDILTTVDIDDTFVGPVGTSFFVGAIISHAAGEEPISIDTNTQVGESWLAADDVNPIDPNDLGAASFVPPTTADNFSEPGNWLIRAEAAFIDCNGNGNRDICDIGAGTSTDCNANFSPDSCDIASGISLDCNANLLPDGCEFPGCVGLVPADLNCDGLGNAEDIARFLELLIQGGYTCQADIDQNGILDLVDGPLFVDVLIAP